LTDKAQAQLELFHALKEKDTSELRKLKKGSLEFREQYAIQISDINNKMETAMKENLNLFQNSFSTLCDIQRKHIDEATHNLTKFRSEIESMTFDNTFKQYFKKLPPFDPKRIIDFDPSTDPMH
jgi:hypothetical protein